MNTHTGGKSLRVSRWVQGSVYAKDEYNAYTDRSELHEGISYL